MQSQPQSVSNFVYRSRMAENTEKDPRKILAANARELSRQWHGRPNVTKFGEFTGIKQGGAQRVFEGQSDIGLGTIEKIAKKAKLEPWQMIAPAFGGAMPHTQIDPMEKKIADLVEKVLLEKFNARGFVSPERAAEKLPPAPPLPLPKARHQAPPSEPQIHIAREPTPRAAKKSK